MATPVDSMNLCAVPQALIVEDDAAMKMILLCMLRKHGFQAVTCESGTEACSIYIANRPDFIVLDWNLPGMNGLDVCRKIRAIDTSGTAYVLMSTANNSVEHIRTALDAGVDDYLTKPFTMELLDIRLRIALQRMYDRQTRQRAEAAMIRTQEMVAVGTLASGITHEFNNINAVISGCIDLALADSLLTGDTRALMLQAKDAARRSTALTRQLLGFVGSGAGSLQIGNVNQILENLLSILEAEYESAGIEFVRQIGDVPFTALDPGGIGQVMLHMLLNARHAIEGCRTRRITVETGCQRDFCFFRIQDTGCGIPEADRDKVFLPFFSRKGEHSVGDGPQSRLRGAGLGLSVSDTIVRSHGGRIELESVVGMGSAFTVWLPLRQPDGALVDTGVREGRRVLVFTETPDLTRWISRCFANSGDRLYTTADFAVACEWHRKTPFDLVVFPGCRPDDAHMNERVMRFVTGDFPPQILQIFPESSGPDVERLPAAPAVVHRVLMPEASGAMRRVLSGIPS